MLYMLFLIFIIIAIFALIKSSGASSKKNKLEKQKLEAEQLERVQKQQAEEKKERAKEKQKSSEFEEEWDLLTRYDSAIRAHIERLEGHGQAAVQELKRVYKITKDKAGLEGVADQIVADIENDKFDPERPGNADISHRSSEMFTIDDVNAEAFAEDGKYKVYKDYQIHYGDDGKWWVETRTGELYPSFTKGYPTLGKAKTAAADKLGTESLF